jgi:hypothetical protein
MATTASQIQQLYLVYFGRPADPNGLAFWLANQSATQESIAKEFAATPEYKAKIAGKDFSQIVNGFYLSLFNRNAEPAGLNFWVAQLNQGKLTTEQVGLIISNAALAQPRTSVDNISVSSKLTAAANYTAEVNKSTAAILAYSGQAGITAGANFLLSVSTAATIPSAAATTAAVNALFAVNSAVTNPNAFPGRPAPAPVNPLLGSLDLSITPTTPPTEQLQSEISTTVTMGGQVFVVSSGGGDTLQVSNSTDPANLTLEERVQFTGYKSQSVASYGNLLAVALSPSDYATNGGRGVVRFYRVGTDGTLAFLEDVQVGYLPDSIAFNDQGTKLVIANEGEPINGYATDPAKDPAGSIGIIDIQGLLNPRFSTTDLRFDNILLPAGIRLSGPSVPAGRTPSQATDIEPEYVSILGNYAYVTLQENNGVAKVNLATNTIEKVFGLGTVDFKNQLVDLTDRDNTSGPNTSFFKPLLGQSYEGLRMADGIAAYSVQGKDFFVTANEGDGRDGAPWSPYSDEVRGSGNANRVKRLADDDKVGSPDRITTFGSRSITVFDADSGDVLWDSGNTLQSVAFAAGVYDDARSDDKGVEPEGIVVAQLNGRSYAIVSLERTTSSMLAVFDVTDPTAGKFVTSAVIPGSVSPEGLHIVDANQSPSGRPQLVVSNEVSNTLNVFDLEALIAAPPVAGAGTFQSTMLKDAAGGPALKISSLITNGEFSNGLNPGDSVYAPTGIFDGMGAYDNGNGTYTLLVNSELGSTAGYGYLVNGVALTGARVSKFIVDKDADDNASNGYQSSIVSGGIAYSAIYDANGALVSNSSQVEGGGFGRFCSSTYIGANSFGGGRGFADGIYLTGEENGNVGRFWALDTATGGFWSLPGLGRAGWENATLIDTGSPNTVGVLLMDDNNAPIYLWVGEKSSAPGANFLERNGLAASQGSLYTWAPSGGSIGTGEGTLDVPDSADLNKLALGTAAAGSWQRLGSGTEVAALSGAQLKDLAFSKGALQLIRLEDVHVNPANGQQAVFATTGGSGADLFGNLITLDFAGAFDGTGRISAGNTTALKVIYDADRLAVPASGIRSPDNLTWSKDGFIYVQEDRSVAASNFDPTTFGEASIWKLSSTATDSVTGQAVSERWAQIDRTAVPAVYGQTDPNPADYGNWESSGIIDVSDFYGAASGSFFLADVQAHNLRNGNIGTDALTSNNYLVEGGQINLIQQQPALI